MLVHLQQMGLGYSVGMGTGLVVARRESDDSWSPPSAIAALSAGWGIQVREAGWRAWHRVPCPFDS